MMIYTLKLLYSNLIQDKSEYIVLVSRDKIFQTFINELDSDFVSFVTNIDELSSI